MLRPSATESARPRRPGRATRPVSRAWSATGPEQPVWSGRGAGGTERIDTRVEWVAPTAPDGQELRSGAVLRPPRTSRASSGSRRPACSSSPGGTAAAPVLTRANGSWYGSLEEAGPEMVRIAVRAVLGRRGWGGAGSSGSDRERGARRSQASWGPALHDGPGDKRAPLARVRGRRYGGPTSKAMSASIESRVEGCAVHVTDSRARFVRSDAMRLPFPDGGRRWRTAAWSSASSLLLTGRRRDRPHPAPWRHARRVPLGLHPGGHGTHPLLLGIAVSLDEGSRELDEAPRLPLCAPGPLDEFLRAAGLADVEVDEINVPTRFRDFDDYWAQFLGGQGHAPSYLAPLSQKGGRSSVWWAPLRLRASRPLRGGGWQKGRDRRFGLPYLGRSGLGCNSTRSVCAVPAGRERDTGRRPLDRTGQARSIAGQVSPVP